ncbi:MAG: N-succinylarginine dihydrolase [Verrucomicrobia bacterium]|jgi:succinylarginine dihydrolase|nr:N-succinylarginine dihydrolase [Verrucomicrobiota bacterium]
MGYSEVNFDGIVGPTHNYAGLAHGNIASTANRSSLANPREAALQSLAKAWTVAEQGFPQAVFPPHDRPAVWALRAYGIPGSSDEEVIAKAARLSPDLLHAASSASAMWVANAFTMTPSCDTRDGRAHFTPANLQSKLHRWLEGPFTETLLKSIFPDTEVFFIHEPLRGGDAMSDEGAANHTRLCSDLNGPGLHLFVYGRSVFQENGPRPTRFPARQTLESVQALARNHQIPHHQFSFAQQSPHAIDSGVFHNDVISVGNRNFLLVHEDAYVEGKDALARLNTRFQNLTGKHLHLQLVARREIPLEEAVRTYLFNSQLFGDEEDGMLLLAPAECRESEFVAPWLDELISQPGNPLREVQFADLRQSMRNGGGPACLRQRVVLDETELHQMKGRLLLDETLYAELTAWICRHYRDRLGQDDLRDPQLLAESRTALDELTRILRLPALYPFQW